MIGVIHFNLETSVGPVSAITGKVNAIKGTKVSIHAALHTGDREKGEY